jgi:hypothetical protein
MKRLLRLAALLTFCAPLVSAAEQSVRFGEFEVHYSAMLAADLQPEVARAYGIERSKGRGITTLAVLKKNGAGVAEPVKASIELSAVNAAGRIAPVPMREIEEHAAVYYVGTFRVADEETLNFNVSITLPDAAVRKFHFRQTFFP